MPTAFETSRIYGSLSRTCTLKEKEIRKYSQMFILIKQFNKKINQLYTKTRTYTEKDINENNERVKKYEDFKKQQKNKLGVFFKLPLVVVSKNIFFGNNNISFNFSR